MAETDANKFSYDSVPLSDASTSIRLLKLFPASFCADGNLYGELYTAPLSELPKYAALSYAWGDNDRTHDIRIISCDQRRESSGDSDGSRYPKDARLLPITSTLDICLRQLLDLTETQIDGTLQDHSLAYIPLWIDQICIDQEDNQEKSCQVQMMGKIYSSAETTYAWLGPAADGSDEIMKAFSQLASHIDNCGYPGDHSRFQAFIRSGYGDQYHHEPWGRSILQQVIHLFAPLAREGKMLAFAERSWFSRIWVIQEFCLSPKVYFVCGGLVLRTELLSLAVDLFEDLAIVRETVPNGDHDGDLLRSLSLLNSLPRDYDLYELPLGHIFWFRDMTMQDNGKPLFEVLSYISTAIEFPTVPLCSTRYRDRIYGLLGLASDWEKLGIRPDYAETTTTAKVLTQAARTIIERTASVCLLRFAQFPKHNVEDDKAGVPLPSWVPDWYHGRKVSYDPRAPRRTLFSTCGKLTAVELLPPSDDAILGLRGYLVDTIEAMGIPWDWVKASNFKYCYYVMEYFAAFDRLQIISREKNFDIYPSTSKRDEAECRVTITDQWWQAGGLGYCRATSKTVTPAFQKLKEAWRCYAHHLRKAMQNSNPDPISEASRLVTDQFGELGDWGSYEYNTYRSHDRTPYVTATKGYLGMAPNHSKPGDAIVIFCGDTIPYVIRPTGDRSNTYTFVGEAYCDGIMDGELEHKLETERQDIYLV